MLGSEIIQTNLASLSASSHELEKQKKTSNINQEKIQNKMNEDITAQKRSITATSQDSNPQKVIDNEKKDGEEKDRNKNSAKDNNKNIVYVRDTKKGTRVDITC